MIKPLNQTEKKRKLIINAAEVDISQVTPEVLGKYESVTVNSGIVFSSPKARELISDYNVNLNCGLTLDKDADTTVSIINGKFEIKPGETPSKPTLLLVNGKLDIAPNTQEVLKGYASIMVNGALTCPESMSSYLGSIKVNGSVDVYPDAAVILESTFVVDKTFALRAKSLPYYAKNTVVIVNRSLDVAKLKEKGVSFITKTAIISEGYVEEALTMFDDKVKLLIVPDGCAYIGDDVELDDLIIRKHGCKLFIDGDLTIKQDGAAAIKQLEYLKVRGNVRLVEDLKEDFFLLDTEYDKLTLIKGFVIADKVSLLIDLNLINMHHSGIMITDCVGVRLSEDIPPELILTKLKFTDCVSIFCTSAQRSAVESVSEDIVSILDDSQKQTEENTSPLNNELMPVVVNVASYKL